MLSVKVLENIQIRGLVKVPGILEASMKFRSLIFRFDSSRWKLCLPAFTQNNIRLLLFRDCDRRGRKCLYDSQHVIRDSHGKFSYIPTNSKSEMKNISEYIFGSVPLSNNNTKRYHKFEGKCVWSQVFCPKRCKYGSNVSGNF
jgi:hypothetical protein